MRTALLSGMNELMKKCSLSKRSNVKTAQGARAFAYSYLLNTNTVVFRYCTITVAVKKNISLAVVM